MFLFILIIYFYVNLARIKDAEQRRILDEAARRRRQRKALEALEQDNFQDDPHADLKMSKKAPKFEESMDTQRKIMTLTVTLGIINLSHFSCIYLVPYVFTV